MTGIETWVSSEAVLAAKFMLGYDAVWSDSCMQTTRYGNLEDHSVEHKTCRFECLSESVWPEFH